jgi:thiol-disulfide isomerase/thioredoxin
MRKKMSRPVLDEESDAVIDDLAESTWVGTKVFSVYIKKTDEGVIVDIYAVDCEDCDALASCYAFDADAAFMREAVENDD